MHDGTRLGYAYTDFIGLVLRTYNLRHLRRERLDRKASRCLDVSIDTMRDGFIWSTGGRGYIDVNNNTLFSLAFPRIHA